jgi:ribosomal protein S18 acetylase RimI-like enzyme
MPAETGETRIRAAGAADAETLAWLGEQGFREAWSGYNDPADMDAYCGEHFAFERVRRDLTGAGVRHFLAERDGQAAGYLRIDSGPAPAAVTGVRPGEISRLYVLRRWHGRGVGPALMQAGLAEAACAGHDVVWLAVWQQAPQALAFYRKWGFEVVGTSSFRLGKDVQEDFVMMRRISRGDCHPDG